MIFANPQAWHLLWLLPLIAAGMHLFYQHRCRMMARFIQSDLIDELAGGLSFKALPVESCFYSVSVCFDGRRAQPSPMEGTTSAR